MNLYNIAAGVKGKVIKDGNPWLAPHIKAFATTKAASFWDEHLICEPEEGALAEAADMPQLYARMGWYGFRRAGWTLLVPGDAVKIKKDKTAKATLATV